MPGAILHLGATVLCTHGGQSAPTAPTPRVLVSGQAVATLATSYVVVGCPLTPSAGGPCTTAQWTVGATRVYSGGQPLVITTGQATCLPTGTPLVPVAAQTRVIAT